MSRHSPIIVFEISCSWLAVDSTQGFYNSIGQNPLITIIIWFLAAYNFRVPGHPVVLIEEFLIDTESGLTVRRRVIVDIWNQLPAFGCLRMSVIIVVITGYSDPSICMVI